MFKGLGRILGEGSGEISPIQKVGKPKDLVRQWNQKRKEYDKLNDDWSPAIAGHLVDLSRDMDVIEDTCIAMYGVSEFIEPLKAMERWKGQSLIVPLNKYSDNEALTAFLARIANNLGNSYKTIRESFEKENAILPTDDGSDYCDLSIVIWQLLSTFWEVGTARALGSPYNVYVTVNIRNMLAGIVCENMIAKEIKQTNRADIYGEFSNFMGNFHVNVGHYFNGLESHMADVYAFSVFHNTSNAGSRGAVLDRVFANFVRRENELPMKTVTGKGL